MDAGRVLESVQPRRPAASMPIKPTVRRKTSGNAERLATPVGPQMMVSGWRIEGAKTLSSTALQKAVEPYVGRNLTATQLQEAAQVVAQTYRDAGYLFVRADVLPQSIQGGVVTITVQEDRLERLDVAADGSRSLPGSVEAKLRALQPLGAPLNTHALDLTLLRINNLPAGGRVSAEVSVVDGRDASAVDVRYTPSDRISGQVQLDGHGHRYTGRARALGQLVVSDPLGLADRFSASVLTTGKRMSYGRLDYQAPVGLSTLLDASLSSLDYDLCCQNGVDRSKGGVDEASLGIAHDWTLQRDRRLTLLARVYGRQLQTRQDGIEDSNRRLQALALGVQGHWQGSAQNNWSLAWHAGSVDLGRNQADTSADAAGRQVDGQFSRLAAGYQRSQSVDANWSWAVSLDGQANLGRNLESSERFFLGGADGVRAYAAGEAVGDSGWLGSVELRRQLPGWPGLSLAGFLDTGRIWQHSRRAAELAGGVPNAYSLSGGGLALRYDTPRYQMVLSVAHPIGDNPAAAVSGVDGEGREDGQTRVWLAMGLRF